MRELPEVIKNASVKSKAIATGIGAGIGISPYLVDLYLAKKENPDVNPVDYFLEPEKDYFNIFKDWAGIGYGSDAVRILIKDALSKRK